MRKIAVCLPSYNEAKNISNITRKIDLALIRLDGDFESIIINADNNSPDKTFIKFKKTKTIHPKLTIIDNKKGKGRNIINFIKYCKDNNITYGITIDSDLKSFKNDWLEKMVKKMEKDKYDFICPLYVRKRYEGNTTNHFILPIMYTLFGKYYRQAIGGDYIFNKTFIDAMLNQKVTDNILLYGIDIYMVLVSIKNNLKIGQLELGKKIHNPSYYKMEHIYENVSKSFIESYNLLQLKTDNHNRNSIPAKYISISNDKSCYFYYLMIWKNRKILKNNYENIRNEWLNCLIYYIHNFNNLDEQTMEKFKETFMKRSLSYWKKYRLKSAKKCEQELINFTYELNRRINNEIIN